MIRIENTDIYGFEAAIRGMRNPKNSWDKSDSRFVYDFSSVCDRVFDERYIDIDIGENDLKLMKTLAAAGNDHGKFMRMINVTCDIIAPLYWWSEYDTYKVGTVANSCSKMHRLLGKPFEINDFSFDKLPGYKNEIKQFKPEIDEEAEIWRKIDCDYDVSSQGRVRHGVRILSGSVHSDHYIFVTLHGKQYPVHRLVAKAFIENVGNKPEVNHIDGNKMNNCAKNLEWVTSSENQIHAVQNNLQPKATSTYKGKFSAEEREQIKQLYDLGVYSKRQLAKKYGVSHSCINDIIGDKYKYVETINLYEETARPLVDMLNELRDLYFTIKDEEVKKKIWYSILQLLPCSYNQRRTVQLNYAVLKNIYHARRAHKLNEWIDFCHWIEKLPYSELITGEKENECK